MSLVQLLEGERDACLWGSVPLMSIVNPVESRNVGMQNSNLLSLSYGRIVRKDIDTLEGLLPASFEGYQIVEPGDIVLRLTDLQNDQRSLRSGLVKERGIITSAYLALRPTSIDPRFLAYVLHALDVAKVFYSMGGGLRQSLKWEELRRLPISLPPLDVQRRIANFLDDQTTRIDNIIKARQQQHDLVALQRRAAFSGFVDQLGASNGWVPLRRLLRSIEQGWSPQCDSEPAALEEWGVLKVGAVKRGRLVPSENKRLSPELHPVREYEIREGDLLITRANTPDLVGEACVVPQGVRGNLILCDKIMRIGLQEGVPPDFIAAVAQTERSRSHFSLKSSGTSQSMVNIRGEDVKDLPIPICSSDEQVALVTYAQRLDDSADLLGIALRESIGYLQELKRSLITSAVSGEFDVSTADGSGVGL